MFSTTLKRVFLAAGLDLRRRRNVPFGVSWVDDLRWIAGSSLDVVLDIGANQGQTAARICRAFDTRQVHSFEPVPTTYRRLVMTAGRLPQVVPHNLAMGDAPGHAVMQANPDSGGNSLLNSSGDVAEVEITTVDAFCAEQQIAAVSLLKIDTEGYEPLVLAGARRMLGCTENVLIECDFAYCPDEPHGDFFAVHPMLAAAGFKLVAFYSGAVDRQRGWVWGDVLYSRLEQVSHDLACSPAA